MANSAQLLTGQSTADGKVVFLYYDSLTASPTNKQPLIMFLHGAGESSNIHDLTTVYQVEFGGIPALTKTASLPNFTDPITGETVHPYTCSPQMYTSGNEGSFIPWENRYWLPALDWMIANKNIDLDRIYLCGLSGGSIGTLLGITTPAINDRLAAAFTGCPGYVSSFNWQYLADSALPLWICGAADDVTPGDNLHGQRICDAINSRGGMHPPKFYYYLSGGHSAGWLRPYVTTEGESYPGFNGIPCVHTLGLFRWLFQYRRRDRGPVIFN
jgi:predicted peptidase